MSGSSVEFILIHGSGFNAAHWEPLRNKLEPEFRVIAPDLPVTDLSLTFEDDAKAVEQAIEGRNNLFIVPHSRGVETLPRLLDRIDLGRVIGAAILSSGGPQAFRPNELGERYTPEYEAGIKLEGAGWASVSDEVCANVMLYDLDEKLRGDTVKNLIKQRSSAHSATNQPLPAMPQGLPTYFILGQNDRVLNLDRARQVAREFFRVEPIMEEWGHVPQLSHTNKLARILTELASASLSQVSIP